MDPDSETRLRRLEDAIEAWLSKDPAAPSGEFLEANAPLRDLLEPVLQSQPLEAEDDPAPVQRLGDLALRREIGRGGMGVGYEAEDRRLRRKVARSRTRQRRRCTPWSTSWRRWPRRSVTRTARR